MIERSATRGVLCEVPAWAHPGKASHDARRCVAVDVHRLNSFLEQTDVRVVGGKDGQIAAVPGGATNKLEQKDMTEQEDLDALVQRLLTSGEVDAAVAERAQTMIDNWYCRRLGRRSRPRTCRDWLDPEIVRLLDEAMI